MKNGLEAINRVTGEKHKASALKEISRLAFADGKPQYSYNLKE
jgi:hypothetical protein